MDGLTKIAKEMQASTKTMNNAIEQLGKPKEVIWDGDKPTGIRAVN